jgi:NADH-quinone oxidoreductase subunit L
MTTAPLAIVAPLGAFLLIILTRRSAAPLALAGALIGLLAAVISLVQVASGTRDELVFRGLPVFPFRLVVDPLAAVLSLTVAVVAFGVFLYAVGYMSDDPDRVRFYAELSFFVGAMQTLVLAGDWILFLAAWELIGLASYLLIGFWFERPGVPASATRAFVTTRGADLGLYVGVFVLVTASGTTRIADTLGVTGTPAMAATLLLLLAAMGKSAQVPFQGWLADAMVGPTPVSALLHSATLVAAGAVLLVRSAPLLPAGILPLIGVVGGLTILLTGFTAVAQRDLKKLLAASTSSQLGFMFLAVGAGSPVSALGFLVAHAAMKSALFLGAGVFQHGYHSTGFDALRGVGHRLRWSFALFAIAGLALAGVPPLSGFWAKDAIVAATLASPWAAVFAPLALVGSVLTGTYVAAMLRQLWLGDAESTTVPGLQWMFAGLLLMTVLSATVGLALGPLAELFGAELPENLISMVLGTLAAATGLLIGWFAPAVRWLGPLRGWAESGFRIRNGWLDVAVRPAIALSSVCNALDGLLLGASLGVGRSALKLAGGPAMATDRRLYASSLAAGDAGLGLAQATRAFDERGIDGLIFRLVRNLRTLGGRARRLQSGLVYRELLVATAATALAILVVLMTR